MTEGIITANQTPRTGAYAPWVGIGATGEWHDYHDALIAADMDFTVARDPAYWMRPEGGNIFTPEPLSGHWVNFRTDTNQVMGIVSDYYGIVQNDEAFALIQPFADAGGVITNAGYTAQGLQFMVLRMKSKTFLGDVYDFDIMCTNSFNGKFPLGLMMTPIRIFCQNLYKALRGSDSILVLYHGNKIQDRILAASAAISVVDDYADLFGKALEDAAAKKRTEKEIDGLIAVLFPYGKNGGPRETESRQRVDEIREEFKQTYYLAADNANYLGTALGFLNAYYDYLSHGQLGKRYRNFQERRLSGIVSGNAVNNQVIERAMH